MTEAERLAAMMAASRKRIAESEARMARAGLAPWSGAHGGGRPRADADARMGRGIDDGGPVRLTEAMPNGAEPGRGGRGWAWSATDDSAMGAGASQPDGAGRTDRGDIRSPARTGKHAGRDARRSWLAGSARGAR